MRIHADRAGCSRAQAVLPLRSQSTEEEANSVDRALTDSKHSIYLVFWHLQKQKLIADWLKNISSYPPLWCYIHIHICFYFFSMPLTLLLLCACQIHPGVYRTERMREREIYILPHMKHDSPWRELLSKLMIQLSDQNQKWVSQCVLEHMRGCSAVYFRSESPEHCLWQHPKEPIPWQTMRQILYTCLQKINMYNSPLIISACIVQISF